MKLAKGYGKDSYPRATRILNKTQISQKFALEICQVTFYLKNKNQATEAISHISLCLSTKIQWKIPGKFSCNWQIALDAYRFYWLVRDTKHRKVGSL